MDAAMARLGDALDCGVVAGDPLAPGLVGRLRSRGRDDARPAGGIWRTRWTGSLRLWELHFRIVLPSYMAMSQFDDLYRDLFGGEGAFGSYRLLQGFDNKTLEADRALWDLSRRALASAAVRRILEHYSGHSGAGGTVERALQDGCSETNCAPTWRQYGLRGEKWGLSYPCWIEDPAAAITNLKDYITRSGPNPRTEQAKLAAERDQAVAGVRERLQGYPRPVIERFEFLLKAAQAGVVLSEDHGYWIDFGSTYRVRRVLLEFGRRLCRGRRHRAALPTCST